MSDESLTTWKQGKQEHQRLSDAVADRYDDVYETSSFATGSYMRFELETITRCANSAPSNAAAVDLGCGTGRDAFVLARHFGQVYGYDFSEAMIRVANRNKLHRRAGNVLFEVLDVEDNPLPLDDACAGLVNSGFGMGSFLFNPAPVFREVRRVLQPKGIAIFSFYNSEALVNSLTLEWKPALAARQVEGQDRLRVEFADSVYEISARAYTAKEIRRRLEGNFHVLEILTFPTLTALFPQTLFSHERARALCTRVDQVLAANTELAAGPYIIAICQKGGKSPRPKKATGYARVLELLSQHNIRPELRSHSPVRNMDDVREVLDASPSEMVKSVLLAAHAERPIDHDSLDAELYLIAIPADRKVDMGSLARLLRKKRAQLRFATQVEIEELTGFEVGSIPPFGLPKTIPVIMDRRLANLKKVWCGTGKATESLHISVDQLKILATYSVADVSKPAEARK
ncbi:MAG TPA: methyltransferase domain-containing protein [Candidatus Acetothermia bacterium]|nr:methyltransferase domain-containing protein [Candidatus Acetothermia bacterium]